MNRKLLAAGIAATVSAALPASAVAAYRTAEPVPGQQPSASRTYGPLKKGHTYSMTGMLGQDWYRVYLRHTSTVKVTVKNTAQASNPACQALQYQCDLRALIVRRPNLGYAYADSSATGGVIFALGDPTGTTTFSTLVARLSPGVAYIFVQPMGISGQTEATGPQQYTLRVDNGSLTDKRPKSR